MIVDRVRQAQVVNALEPEWEARFEPKSYGFRPGRGCHDAISAIFTIARARLPSGCWVLDADLAAAFDRIDHAHLLSPTRLRSPPRELIEGWLKAGVVENGRLRPDRGGNPPRWGDLPVAVEHRFGRDGRAPLASATCVGTQPG